MPNYNVTTPDGQSVSVTAPPGADSSSIFSFVKDALGPNQGTDPYIGNPNITRQGARAGVGSRTDNFSGPATAFLGGLLGMAPDEQGGSVLDPGSAINSPNAANAGFMLGTAAQALPLAKGLFSLGSGADDALSFASRSAKIRSPQPLPQRPFSSDYNPQSVTGPNGSQLTTDIGGNPLSASAIIAGRRVVGGVDEGLSGIDQNWILDNLAIPRRFVAASDLPTNAFGTYGRITARGPESEIKLWNKLSPEDVANVQTHEFGHAINDIAGIPGVGPENYGQIPVNGIVRQLDHNYDLLNNRQPGNPSIPRKPKQQATPKLGGYKPDEWDSEKLAEAIRGYATDPNYFKTVAPDVAARVRQLVNTNPRLKDFVQFNSAGAGLAGIGSYLDDPDQK